MLAWWLRSIAGVLTSALVTVATAGAGEVREHRLVVVTPSATDERVDFLHEAVAFWNRSLRDMGLDMALVEIALHVAPEETRALENYTRKIWQQAGRTRPGRSSPSVPEEVTRLGGDVVVFFSSQPTMSFAWPLLDDARHFVAVPREPGSRFLRAGSTRNVIAHELGHTLGLVHHRNNSVVLMCSPCRPTDATADAEGFLPLTDRDRARLRSLHPAN